MCHLQVSSYEERINFLYDYIVLRFKYYSMNFINGYIILELKYYKSNSFIRISVTTNAN